MKQQRVAVTGLGIVSAVGSSIADTWRAILEERSGLAPLTLFESRRWQDVLVGQVGELPTPAPRDGRSTHLAHHAAREALIDAGLDNLSSQHRSHAAFVLGICTGGMFESETFAQEFLRHGRWPIELLEKHTCANTTNAVASRLGMEGPRHTVSNACASGGAAISIACEMLQSGQATMALAGGVDSLTRLILNGFCSLLVVSPNGCRPFDADRKGMSVGEGAAMLVLETEEHARRRGATIHGFIAGWGNTCSAYHAAAPEPDGQGALLAMAQALQGASLRPGDVDYVNAHGSGTTSNDSAESEAIARLFADKFPMVSSTKRFFGHTLAAAGAIEAVVCLLALKHQMVPANLGLQAACEEAVFPIPMKTEHADIKVALSNSIGFGGSNCSLVITGANSTGSSVSVQRDKPAEVVVEGLGMIQPQGNLGRIDFPWGAESRSCAAYQCPAHPPKGLINPRSARRLGRVQGMGVSAAHLAMREAQNPPDGQNVSVYLGTGLGSVTDTNDFVENMILKDEMEPRPASFINSVHNSIASWIAIEFGFKGRNFTFTHDATSFDQALERAMTDMASGEVKHAMVVGADELCPYPVAVGHHHGWWRQGADGLLPMQPSDDGSEGTVPGEGATAVLLSARAAGRAGDSVRIRAASSAVLRKRQIVDLDPQVAIRFILETLARSGGTIQELDCVLLGANGDSRHDSMYGRVARALSEAAGKELSFGVYKHLCGEFCTASATGLGTAIELLRGRPAGVQLVRPGPTAPPAGYGAVLMYNLYESGFHSVCWLAK